MALLKPAVNTSAFLKMGIMGKQGAGKTKTAAQTAIGLILHLRKMGIAYAEKPAAFFDTETGSDFVEPDFRAAGIALDVAKSRTLKDLVDVIDEAERNNSVLIIDSISHPYRELIASYLKQKSRTFLQIDDWNYIKGPYGWEQFTKRYINSKLHIIMAGRAGDDLEQYTDEQGKRQLEKVGVKMKTEAETGFEPSLLVLMELIEKNKRENGQRERLFVRRATIVKDRWDVIDGMQFDDPTFRDFLPHIERLALGGEHVGVNDTGDSRSILRTEKRDWQPVQRKIVLGEIEDLIVMHVPGMKAEDKQRKVALIRDNFGCGWVEVEEVMPLDELRAGYDKLHRVLEEGRPSKYAVTAAAAVDDGKPIDRLPDHSAPSVAASEPTTATSGLSIEEHIRKQLDTLTTTNEVTHFAMEVSRRDDLDARARMRLSDAVTARLKEVAQATQTAEEKPEKLVKPARKSRAQAAGAPEAEEEGEPKPGGDQVKDEAAPIHAVAGSNIPLFV